MSVDYKAVYERAFLFASEKHKNDLRKDGKTPYMHHVLAVIEGTRDIMNNLSLMSSDGVMYAVLSVAALHDVVEDHPETAWNEVFRVLSGDRRPTLETSAYANSIVGGVKAITKKPKGQEEYSDYVVRVHSHLWARIVKLADLAHNMSDLGPGSMRDKYSLTKFVLSQNLKEDIST